jgi:DNA repair protein RadC
MIKEEKSHNKSMDEILELQNISKNQMKLGFSGANEPGAKYKGVGHRQRLRKRFLQSGLDGFLDYEIIELLLTLGTPMRDCKSMAKEAIKHFGGIYKVLEAPDKELQKIKGIGPSNIFGLKLFQAISERLAKEKISKKILFNSPKAVADYLQLSIGCEKEEHFVMLHLDSRLGLIKEDISIGTLNASLVHPRELFKKAIQANAAQVIIAHNHPSGDPTPSPEDIALTRHLTEAAKVLEIEILDHIIVTRNSFSSLKEQNLI